jgi:hypothetical protein
MIEESVAAQQEGTITLGGRGSMLIEMATGHVTHAESQNEAKVGALPDKQPQEAKDHQTKLVGNNFTVTGWCKKKASTTVTLAAQELKEKGSPIPKSGSQKQQVGSVIEADLPKAGTQTSTDANAVKINDIKPPDRFGSDGKAQNSFELLDKKRAPASDKPPQQVLMLLGMTMRGSAWRTEQEMWMARPLVQLSLSEETMSPEEMREHLEMGTAHLKRQPKHRPTAKHLEGILKEYSEASVMLHHMVHHNEELMQVAEPLLGTAAVHCSMQKACNAAQKAVLRLIEAKVCYDDCAMTAITRLGFIKHQNNLHPDMLAFFQTHSRRRESEHWEAANLMLGSMARSWKQPELVAHMHNKVDSNELSADDLHVALNTLGNAAYPRAVESLERFGYHHDVLLQRTAVSALRNVPPTPASMAAVQRIGRSSASANNVRHAACQHLQKHGHKDAEQCFNRIKRDHLALRMRRSAEVNPVVAEMLQDNMLDQAVEGILKDLHMPFNLNITHFLDKTWGLQMGGEKINFKLHAGLATELNAVLGDNALKCVAKKIITGKYTQEDVLASMAMLQEQGKAMSGTPDGANDATTAAATSGTADASGEGAEGGTGSGGEGGEAEKPKIDMHMINKCLMDNADFSAMIDATGEASITFFGSKISLIKATFTAAASLFPLPLPQGDERWVDVMQNNYRVDLSLSIFDVCIPIFKGGKLVKNFRTRDISDTLHKEDGRKSADGAGEDSDADGETLLQAPVSDMLTSGNAHDLFSPAGGKTGVSKDCSKQTDFDSGFLKTVWSKDWTLGSLEFPIVPGLLNIGIVFKAGLGLKVGYNFAPCGGIFDLSIFGSGSAVPYAYAKVEGQVYVGFAFFKIGIALDIPIIDLNLPVTASLGAKLQDMGSLQGDMHIQLVLNPWTFAIKLFMEINLVIFKIKLEFIIWQLHVAGFRWTLWKGDFTIPLGGKGKKELESMPLALTQSHEAKLDLTIPLPDPTPAGVALNYKVETLVSKDPLHSKGKVPYTPCTQKGDCRSGICATIGSGGRACRPTAGFGVGTSCYYSRDCNRGLSEFCRDAKTTTGRCAALGKDMESCEENAECSSGTCAIAWGVACIFKEKNCMCRPDVGFPKGTHATSELDCASRKTTKNAKGLPICD